VGGAVTISVTAPFSSATAGSSTTAPETAAAGRRAIDVGDNAACALIGNRDQRGFIRPIGRKCDIGAVEKGPNLYLPVIVRRAGDAAGQRSPPSLPPERLQCEVLRQSLLRVQQPAKIGLG
jgi:hypothetical protein